MWQSAGNTTLRQPDSTVELLPSENRQSFLIQRLSSPQKACQVIAKPQRHFPGCRGEMLSTTWQGEPVTRCLAVVPNITSPNVRPWW